MVRTKIEKHGPITFKEEVFLFQMICVFPRYVKKNVGEIGFRHFPHPLKLRFLLKTYFFLIYRTFLKNNFIFLYLFYMCVKFYTFKCLLKCDNYSYYYNIKHRHNYLFVVFYLITSLKRVILLCSIYSKIIRNIIFFLGRIYNSNNSEYVALVNCHSTNI